MFPQTNQTQGTQPGGGSLFGQSATGVQGSLFSSATSTSGQPSLFSSVTGSGTGGVFGAKSTFGGAAGGNQPNAQSILGGSAQPAVTQGSLFGQTNPGAGGFGQGGQNTGALFSQNPQDKGATSGGLFGGGSQPQGAPQNFGGQGPLFSGTNAAAGGNVFGQGTATGQQPFGGASNAGSSPFGATAPANQLFGQSQQQQQQQNPIQQQQPGQPGLFGASATTGGGFSGFQNAAQPLPAQQQNLGSNPATGLKPQQNLFGQQQEPKEGTQQQPNPLFGAQQQPPMAATQLDQKPNMFGGSNAFPAASSQQNQTNLFGASKKDEQQQPQSTASSGFQQQTNLFGASGSQQQPGFGQALGSGSATAAGSLFNQKNPSGGGLEQKADQAQKPFQQKDDGKPAQPSLLSNIAATSGGAQATSTMQNAQSFGSQLPQKKADTAAGQGDQAPKSSKIPAFISGGDQSQAKPSTSNFSSGSTNLFGNSQKTAETKEPTEKKGDGKQESLFSQVAGDKQSALGFGKGQKDSGNLLDSQKTMKPSSLFESQSTTKPTSSGFGAGQAKATPEDQSKGQTPLSTFAPKAAAQDKREDQKKEEQSTTKIPGFGMAKEKEVEKEASGGGGGIQKNLFSSASATAQQTAPSQEQKKDDTSQLKASPFTPAQPTPQPTEQKRPDSQVQQQQPSQSATQPPVQAQTSNQQQQLQQSPQQQQQIQQQQQPAQQQPPVSDNKAVEDVINQWSGQVRDNEQFFNEQSKQLLEWEKMIFTCIDSIQKIEEQSALIRANYIRNAKILKTIRDDQDEVYKQLLTIEQKLDSMITGDSAYASSPLAIYNDPFSGSRDYLTSKQSIYSNAITIQSLAEEIGDEVKQIHQVIEKASNSRSTHGQFVLLLDNQPVRVDDTLNMYYETLLWLENAAVDLKFQVEEVELRLHQAVNQY